ncbi:MAG: hypothetical protein M1541_11700, partial [Acidobacteria bacterium]|nr:hypothetical protein [Acidobacteriota bacterium]
ELRQMVEAIGSGIQLTEPGWRLMNGAGEEHELDPNLRADALQASYYYWQLDPLMSRAVQLIKDYTFGRGVTWQTEDPGATRALDRFWDSRENAILNKAVGQWELAERIQLAGEVFLIFFVSKLDGKVTVRVVEPEEITNVITDDQDKRKVLYYERRWRKQGWSWASKTWAAGEEVIDYIPDWNNERPDPSRVTVGDAGTYVCMHHIKVNSHGVRGTPLYLRVIAWVKAYKGFMEDRATLTLAAATFAFKQKVTGSAAAVARMASKWLTGSDPTSRYGGTGGREREPGAKTLVENQNVSLEPFQTNTNAANAYLDGRMLRQQISAGAGITEQNLTGDPSVANLASATQMEGPMLKLFESWQQLWRDEFVDIFRFVVAMAVLYQYIAQPEDPWAEVSMPPIVTKDLQVVVSAVASLITAETAAGKVYVPDRRKSKYLLEAFGEQDVNAALAELEADQPAPADVPPEGMVEVNEDLSEADSTRLATIIPKRVATLPSGSLAQSMFIEKVAREFDDFGRLFTLALRQECPQSGEEGESGTTANSIRYAVVNKMSPDVALHFYAGNAERPEVVVRTILFGSKAHVIRAKNPAKPLTFFWTKGPDGPRVYQFLKVNHPGTEANDFFQRAWDKVAPQRQAMIARIGALANEVISKRGYRKA